MQKQTQAIRTRADITNEMEHSTPLFLTSSFTFDNAADMQAAFADQSDDNIYSRFSNPTVQEFINKMCLLEGAEDGVATATGMSAVYRSMCHVQRSGGRCFDDHTTTSNLNRRLMTTSSLNIERLFVHSHLPR